MKHIESVMFGFAFLPLHYNLIVTGRKINQAKAVVIKRTHARARSRRDNLDKGVFFSRAVFREFYMNREN